jgi:hypothetical protein
MKNVKKLMTLAAVILGFAASASAQNGFTLRAGGNFPVGAFNNGENAAELALSNPEATLGGAAIGFNAGVKYQFGVVGNLSAFATADFFCAKITPKSFNTPIRSTNTTNTSIMLTSAISPALPQFVASIIITY